jgi:hypothetical protein
MDLHHQVRLKVIFFSFFSNAYSFMISSIHPRYHLCTGGNANELLQHQCSAAARNASFKI